MSANLSLYYKSRLSNLCIILILRFFIKKSRHFEIQNVGKNPPMAKYVIFKNPYILIEDVRTRQQPFYKEYEAKQPKLSLNSPALGCPFVENMKRRIMPPKNKDLKPGFVRFAIVNLHSIKSI